MMNTASRDPFVYQADTAYDDHIKKQGQAPSHFDISVSSRRPRTNFDRIYVTKYLESE